jgi:hypothetical protein
VAFDVKVFQEGQNVVRGFILGVRELPRLPGTAATDERQVLEASPDA